MIEINPLKTTQMLFDNDEYHKLKIEIEEVFSRIDTKESGLSYSLKRMRQEYPVLAELFAGKIG